MSSKITAATKNQAALYALNALSENDRKKFEKQLTSNPNLQKLIREYENTLTLAQDASLKVPTEEYLQGQRNLLHGRIEQLGDAKSKRPVKTLINKYIESIFSTVVTTRHPAWAIATYVIIAFFIGRYSILPSSEPAVPEQSIPIEILQLLESGSLSNANIDISKNDKSAISLALHTNQNINVTGGLDDESVRQLIYYLLLNDQNPGNRLKAIELIGKIIPNKETQQVLISSLLSDPNPGIRLRSIKLLHTFNSDELLINACQKVLLEDTNEAVRMEALSILATNPTANLVPLLQLVSRMDENEFIRDQSKKIIAEMKYHIDTEKIEVIQ